MQKHLCRKINNRLRSTEGASLSVALLFFVMCAVVGSVILAAAGTTAGRISRIQESDRKRYALESAAQVLENKIVGGETVKFVTNYRYDEHKGEEPVDGRDGEPESPANHTNTAYTEADKKEFRDQARNSGVFSIQYSNGNSDNTFSQLCGAMLGNIISNENIWRKIVNKDPDLSRPGSDPMDERYWNGAAVWRKEITYQISWNSHTIKNYVLDDELPTNSNNITMPYASSSQEFNSDNTNVITLTPDEKAERVIVSQKEFTITLTSNDVSTTDYPVVDATAYMDQYGRITVVLKTHKGQESSGSSSEGKGSEPALMLVLEATPARVQYDLLRRDEPVRPVTAKEPAENTNLQNETSSDTEKRNEQENDSLSSERDLAESQP